MHFWCSLIFVLASGWGAAAAQNPCDANRPAADPNLVTIFVTGNTLGQLKPCGCSGGQLGGFEKRPAVFDKVSKENRLLIDTGRLIEKADAQGLIKFTIITQALEMLDYDVVNLTAADLATAESQGVLEQGDKLKFITPGDEKVPAIAVKTFKVGGAEKTFAVIAIGDKAEDVIGKLPAGAFVIGVFDSSNVQENIKSKLDMAIMRAEDTDTPMMTSGKGVKPMVLTAGRKGKYIAKVELRFDGNSPKVSFKAIGLTEKVAVDESLVSLYKTYQTVVKDDRLLEKHPKFVLPGDLEYIGSKSCAGSPTMTNCHEYEYKMWQTKKHAIAMDSLKKVGSEYDPECVVCHVVGMDYKDGFLSMDDSNSKEFGNVGCESCHGPGSEHLVTAGKAKTREPKVKCADCHTAEQSPEFSSKESEYYNKVVHWKEPLKFSKRKFPADPNIK